MDLLQLAVTWYMLEGKLPTGTSKTKKIQIYLDEVALFWMSQWAACPPACTNDVTACCKRPIPTLYLLNINQELRTNNIGYTLGASVRLSLKNAFSYNRSCSLLLEFPFPVVKWTNLTSLQPARDAVKVESMLSRDGKDNHLEFFLPQEEQTSAQTLHVTQNVTKSKHNWPL